MGRPKLESYMPKSEKEFVFVGGRVPKSLKTKAAKAMKRDGIKFADFLRAMLAFYIEEEKVACEQVKSRTIYAKS